MRSINSNEGGEAMDLINEILSRFRTPVAKRNIGGINTTFSKSGISASTKLGDKLRVGVTPSGKLKAKVNLGDGLNINYKPKNIELGEKFKENKAILQGAGLLAATVLAIVNNQSK